MAWNNPIYGFPTHMHLWQTVPASIALSNDVIEVLQDPTPVGGNPLAIQSSHPNTRIVTVPLNQGPFNQFIFSYINPLITPHSAIYTSVDGYTGDATAGSVHLATYGQEAGRIQIRIANHGTTHFNGSAMIRVIVA